MAPSPKLEQAQSHCREFYTPAVPISPLTTDHFIGPTTLNSDGMGDITLSSTVDGATDLTLDSGGNDIFALAAIGGITPINNLTIINTNDATFSQLINAQTLNQLAGSGTTTFNGPVTTSLVSGLISMEPDFL